MANRPDGIAFDYEGFAALVQTIVACGYAFLRLDERAHPAGAKAIYLRHDVDISPYSALQIGRIESSLKVQSSFLFMLSSEAYNLFNPDVLTIVRELRTMGHCVGLHIDAALLGSLEENIHLTLDWFDRCVTPIDPVVSFHRPSPSVLGRHYDRFINAYDSALFSPSAYLSDSRRDKAFYPRLLTYLDEGRTPLQLLLHPEWWYPEQDTDRFMDLLIRRRTAELQRYLATHFNAVFGGHVQPEDRSHRL